MPLGMKTASSAATISPSDPTVADPQPTLRRPKSEPSVVPVGRFVGLEPLERPETGSAGCAAPDTQQASAFRRMTAARW